MEDLFYWIIEYCKVIFGYGFLMFLWPMIMFRKFLSGKSVTFRFSFCVTAQVVLLNTVVLSLGLFNILNVWTMRIVFYGPLLYSLRDYYLPTAERRKKLRYLINGTYGVKNFLMQQKNKAVHAVKKVFRRFGNFYKKHWLEYSLLIVVLVYAMLYFSWGTLHDRTYGFSDIVVHHSWIYGLVSGEPFSAGIYPEGMHCVIYAVHALFGIDLYSCVIFVALANLVATFLAIYCFMKELFRSRYSAILVFVLIMSFGDVGTFVVWCMSRLQSALPQEFAFHAVFLCILYLLKYLKGSRRTVIRGKETKRFWNEDLLIFTLAFTATITIHFYATFLAFFVCVVVVFVLWKRVFCKERFLPLVAAVLCGIVISAAPMVTGFATGIPLQGSLYWAMGVMQAPSTGGSTGGSYLDNELEQITGITEDTGTPTGDESVLQQVWNKILEVSKPVRNNIKAIGTVIYLRSYLLLYSKAVSLGILGITAVVLTACLLGTVFRWIAAKIRKKERKQTACGNYLIILFSYLMYILVYSASALGLPELVEKNRTCFILHLFVCMTVVIPIDYILSVAKRILPSKLINAVYCILMAGILYLIWNTGNYHGYLYFELTRFDTPVQIIRQISEDLPKGSFTVVSTTEDLYQVNEYGWHEELISFVEKVEDEVYTLPSEYVFLMVEKKPFEFLQVHFFDGPDWLAAERYSERYTSYSRWPNYVTGEISEEAADRKIPNYANTSYAYMVLESRETLQSKLYEWCRQFKQKYPNEFKVYYEDEYVVCYYFKQNTESVYNLSLE